VAASAFEPENRPTAIERLTATRRMLATRPSLGSLQFEIFFRQNR
jgi:hypothetical protein